MLRTIVPRTIVFGATAAMFVLGHAMAVTPSAQISAVPAEQSVAAKPIWTMADAVAYTNCMPASAWPSGDPAEFVVVHSFRDDVSRKIAFDLAWRLNHDDNETDDVWVLGICH